MRCVDGNAQLGAQLVDVRDLPADIKYLTLSHAWGQHKFLPLTRDNLAQFQRSIPISAPDFNQTFKDALRVTIALEYGYIWIDSLCILQESDALDCAAECPRMGSIYCNSDLNLSASGYHDSQCGMLGPSRRLEVPPTIYYPGGESLRVIHVEEYWSKTMPLDRRGWVIQENMLVSQFANSGRWPHVARDDPVKH